VLKKYRAAGRKRFIGKYRFIMENIKFCDQFQKYARLMLFIWPVFLLGGCVDLTLQSAWKDHEIVFDGNVSAWQNTMVKEKNVAFGAFNDDENLYLCLSITDKVTKAQTMGLFKQDFYVWVDTGTGMQSKRLRNFGLRFTNGSVFMDEDMLIKTRYLQVHAFQVVADEMMSHLTIQVMRDYYPVASLSEAKGIDSGVWVFKDGRQLVYELKVPLVKSAEHPYAIGASPGAPVYVGIETTPINVALLENQLRLDEYNEMKSEASMEGPGVRGMHRRMSAVQRQNFEAEVALENFRPIQIWCKVILARKS